MKYLSSIEKDLTVSFKELKAAFDDIETHIVKAFDSGLLASLEIEFIFVPVLMSSKFIGGYPARSRYSKVERAAYCSPQLDYARYQAGDHAAKKRVICDGLLTGAILLKRAGATVAQIEEFIQVVNEAAA